MHISYCPCGKGKYPVSYPPPAFLAYMTIPPSAPPACRGPLTGGCRCPPPGCSQDSRSPWGQRYKSPCLPRCHPSGPPGCLPTCSSPPSVPPACTWLESGSCLCWDSSPPGMDCALHCATAFGLHCIEMHGIIPQCIVLHFIGLYGIQQHCIGLYSIGLNCIGLHHWTTQYWTKQYWTTL